MKRKINILIVSFLGLFCTLFIFESCSTGPTPTEAPITIPVTPFGKFIPTAQINQVKGEWVNRLDQAKQKWMSLNITSYELKVSLENTTWSPIDIYHVIVRNNNIVEKENKRTDPVCCSKGTPYPTFASFDAEKYTIKGLFDIAYSEINSTWVEDTSFRIEFDINYDFPKLISSNSFRYTDVQKVWRVEEFKEL